MILLQTKNLVKKYGGRTVVDHVSITVNQGEIVGLLGRNGAGKTTTFRQTIGMITPESGTVMFDGVDVTNMPMYKRARRGMGYLSQEPSIFQRLSVRDNLLAILETMHMSAGARQEKCDHLLEQFGLTIQQKQLARTLSGGERRKLEIARALVTNPTMILLDEPFSGVDPIAVEDLQREILGLRDRGISILLTDHNVRETLTVTDRSYIMDSGKVLREGPPRELVNDDLVRMTYLGQTFRGDEFDIKARRR
ncbi:MAG: LPS export ABC transporter ATP-binding protein [Phycisphaerae bacterium]|nr:LPS export ABC transporter ATP-binding protein [Phycisphaerae bacterium]